MRNLNIARDWPKGGFRPGAVIGQRAKIPPMHHDQSHPASDTVAERRLILQTGTTNIEVVASLGRPKEVGPDEWICACITRFGDEVNSMDIHGADGMQALQLAMVTLDVQLKYEVKRRGGTLLHFDEPFNSILEDGGMQPKQR